MNEFDISEILRNHLDFLKDQMTLFMVQARENMLAQVLVNLRRVPELYDDPQLPQLRPAQLAARIVQVGIERIRPREIYPGQNNVNGAVLELGTAQLDPRIAAARFAEPGPAGVQAVERQLQVPEIELLQPPDAIQPPGDVQRVIDIQRPGDLGGDFGGHVVAHPHGVDYGITIYPHNTTLQSGQHAFSLNPPEPLDRCFLTNLKPK